jgi:DNA-directed RNA polymerase subunit RPC12/RpoP
MIPAKDMGVDFLREANMTLRLFRCPDCGHRMRLFGPRCGRCGAAKSLSRRPASYAAGVSLVLIGFVAVSLR